MYDSKITYRMNYSINQRQSSRPKREWDLGKDKNEPSSEPSASFFAQRRAKRAGMVTKRKGPCSRLNDTARNGTM